LPLALHPAKICGVRANENASLSHNYLANNKYVTTLSDF